MRDILLSYQPSTMILVDDDAQYLQQLSFKLHSYPYIVQTFDSGHNFLEFINNEYKRLCWTQKFVQQDTNLHHHYQQWSISLELYKLPLEIYNNERFKQVSCIIMDYSMPGINGLALLEQIRQPHIKRILLTGIADEQTAIQAFNQGIIDAYIMKSDSNMLKILIATIDKLTNQYFHNLSRTALDIIAYNDDNTCLIEPKFRQLFSKIISDYNIVEYYLFEKFGCYIMLDAKGRVYGFYIYPEQDVQEVLADIDMDDLVKSFKIDPHIMCYHTMIEPSFPVGNNKKTYLVKAQEFIGDYSKYYFAVTEGHIDIQPQNIVSFDNYKLHHLQ